MIPLHLFWKPAPTAIATTLVEVAKDVSRLEAWLVPGGHDPGTAPVSSLATDAVLRQLRDA